MRRAETVHTHLPASFFSGWRSCCVPEISDWLRQKNPKQRPRHATTLESKGAVEEPDSET
ncbi:hypothetical protein FOMPIDRAFT_1022854 [Fomitopsis schrenkii]|uniref:Uncharacterized protein n=1 Tax=Fomitopsis schrenkii TaxID=2126942 RepID=S8EC13_FOMSC|nr:hypothetical protein FOMPIDRAFT_1022854 [Fomitopsis schrenkii]